MYSRGTMTRVCLVVLAGLCSWVLAYESATDGEARALLAEFEEAAAKVYNTVILKTWAFNTNITDHNRKIKEEGSLIVRKFKEEWNNKVQVSLRSDLSPETARAMRMAFSVQLDPADSKNLTSILTSLSTIYSTATVCLTPKSCVSLDPDLTRKMAESRNYDELKFIWESWRTNVSRKMRPLYLQYMELANKKAVLNDYTDYGDQLRMHYETKTFEEDMLNLYKELDPLYRLIHAFVRKRLRLVYPQIKARGHLPACVLGDMWGRFWTSIFPLVTPYSEAADMDVTSAMLKQNYTVKRMFTMGEEFFTSMGLKPLPATFWERSMLERPQDGRNVSCHPTAWDFIDGKDFRIKMCTEVNFDHLATIHHELGHIQYFIQYAHQPLTYRGGANDGFHEAIGELMSMSMSTRKHLAKVGLLEDVPENTETSINFLLRTALLSVTTLPFHLVNDLWRWRAFRGEYDLRDYNTNYWKLKEQYLGVEAPVNRTDEDLDPPAIFHISSDYDMIRYFTRTILQFQFLEKLCEAAGHEGPLHTCDFYGSKEAGNLLAKMLSMGSSKPWQDVLEVMTGERHMNPRPLLRYFQPLQQWLLEDNIKDGDGVGWGDSWALLDSSAGTWMLQGQCTPLLLLLSLLQVLYYMLVSY
ncbi:angiotensin-converting enzyme-like [Procambarus clarkii]|uniref:angiotensin-converting enzyme-like n=1 Tax=Procambarus clarkii TaxID=6728 RepID=UPI00374291E8